MSSPTDRLPHVDELSVEVEADADATWEAVLRVTERTFGSPATGRLARLLACSDLEASGPRPLAAGSAFPGFHIEVAAPSTELALAGRHRFSDYALVLRLDDLGNDRTRLRAETRARFPGLKGRVYRTLVIGTRMHVLFTKRVLAAVKRSAERR